MRPVLTTLVAFRYVACTPSPNISPNPAMPFHRTLPPPPPAPPVSLSFLDRSNFLRLAPDGLTCTTDRGFRSGRATVAVREGTWYYEATVIRGDGASGGGRGSSSDNGNPHVRIGWGRREAVMDAPVGADGYSYAIRDVGGEKMHISRAKAYGRTFATGDVIGCLIHLPPRAPPPSDDEDDAAHVRRWRIAVRYRGQLYFEMDEYPATKEMEALLNREGKPPAPATPPEAPPNPNESKKKMKKDGTSGKGGDKNSTSTNATAAPPNRTLHKLPGSYISFFLNGEPLADHPAFEDIYDFLPLPPLPGQRRKYTHAYERERAAYQYHDDGTMGYFPMVSCFGRGKLHLNFGPDFARPPAPGVLPADTQPLSARWDAFRAEELAYDERDEAATAERLRRELAQAEVEKAEAAAKAAARAERSATAAAAAAAGGTPTAGTPTGTPTVGTPNSAGGGKRPSKKKKTATPAPGEGRGGASRDGTPGLGGLGRARSPGTNAATAPATPAPSSPGMMDPGMDVDMDAEGEEDDAEGERERRGAVQVREHERERNAMDVHMGSEEGQGQEVAPPPAAEDTDTASPAPRQPPPPPEDGNEGVTW